MTYDPNRLHYAEIPEDTPIRQKFRYLYNTARYVAINYGLDKPRKILRHYKRAEEDTLVIEAGTINEVTIKIARSTTHDLITVFYASELDPGRLIADPYCPGQGDTSAQNWELHLDQLYPIAQLYDERFESTNQDERKALDKRISFLEDNLAKNAPFIITKNIVTPADNLPPTKSFWSGLKRLTSVITGK